MTYFYELGQVVTRDPEVRSGTLVFDGTRVPMEALLDDLQRGQTPKEFLSDHPTVFPEQVRAYVTCWEDILRDAEAPEAARRRLLTHADWALISERVARRIDAETGDARKPPDVGMQTAWAEDVARELGGGSGTEEVEQGAADRPGEGRPRNRNEAEGLTDAIHTLGTPCPCSGPRGRNAGTCCAGLRATSTHWWTAYRPTRRPGPWTNCSGRTRRTP